MSVPELDAVRGRGITIGSKLDPLLGCHQGPEWWFGDDAAAEGRL
jgi:hypothetical protein